MKKILMIWLSCYLVQGVLSAENNATIVQKTVAVNTTNGTIMLPYTMNATEHTIALTVYVNPLQQTIELASYGVRVYFDNQNLRFGSITYSELLWGDMFYYEENPDVIIDAQSAPQTGLDHYVLASGIDFFIEGFEEQEFQLMPMTSVELFTMIFEVPSGLAKMEIDNLMVTGSGTGMDDVIYEDYDGMPFNFEAGQNICDSETDLNYMDEELPAGLFAAKDHIYIDDCTSDIDAKTEFIAGMTIEVEGRTGDETVLEGMVTLSIDDCITELSSNSNENRVEGRSYLVGHLEEQLDVQCLPTLTQHRTVFKYQLGSVEQAKLYIIDANGQIVEVRTLTANSSGLPGFMEYDASHLDSGIYYVHLVSVAGKANAKIVVAK
ncbi:MAG: T9SS type A sorting domain-containing protein [Bacteroidota bacterium]